MAQSKLFRFQNSADTVWHIFLLQANVIKSESFIHHYVQQHRWGPEKGEEEEDLSAIKSLMIFIRDHLGSIFTSTAIDDPRWPCLMGARVLVNGGNFPQAQMKKGGNCCASLRRRRRLSHTDLIFYQSARLLSYFAMQNLIWRRFTATRELLAAVDLICRFSSSSSNFIILIAEKCIRQNINRACCTLRITLALKHFSLIRKGCNGKIMLPMLQI